MPYIIAILLWLQALPSMLFVWQQSLSILSSIRASKLKVLHAKMFVSSPSITSFVQFRVRLLTVPHIQELSSALTFFLLKNVVSSKYWRLSPQVWCCHQRTPLRYGIHEWRGSFRGVRTCSAGLPWAQLDFWASPDDLAMGPLSDIRSCVVLFKSQAFNKNYKNRCRFPIPTHCSVVPLLVLSDLSNSVFAAASELRSTSCFIVRHHRGFYSSFKPEQFFSQRYFQFPSKKQLFSKAGWGSRCWQ